MMQTNKETSISTKEEILMMTAKNVSKDFCSALFQSWLRVDTAYLQDKKASEHKADGKKA